MWITAESSGDRSTSGKFSLYSDPTPSDVYYMHRNSYMEVPFTHPPSLSIYAR